MELQRSLRFGPYTVLARDQESASVPYFLAGRKMNHVGMITGDIQPIGAEHLVGEMGGMWAHPMKVADGLSVRLIDEQGNTPLAHSTEVIELLSHIEWRYRVGGLEARRRDLIVEDQAAFVSLLQLTNRSARVRRGQAHLQIWLKFLGNWFGGVTTGESEYWLEDTMVLGYDRLWQGRWGVACGTTDRPSECRIEARSHGRVATLIYPYEVGPGETYKLEFVLAADHERGHEGARHLFSQVIGSGERRLKEKVEIYNYRIFTGVALDTPDAMVDRSFGLAKANLQLLAADYGPHLSPYFLAGVPEYPQLFGCDNTYNTPGAVAAGFADLTKSTLLALADFASRACGRVPHEVTTNGRVFNPGNTQETPQFVIASWDYFRWTGDFGFLRRVYSVCREGVMDYLPSVWMNIHTTPYPFGDAMVERHGMGPYKLDSVCYLYEAYGKLREMAQVLSFPEHVAEYTARLTAIEERFDHDWWCESEGMYADSLEVDLTQRLDGHWTVIVPIQLGLGTPEHRARSFERIQREWINELGLVHTRVTDERVWTLPTGLAALAAFRCGNPELGVRLLQNIAVTASYGMLGAFKELIPIGLCFVQLWSAGLYVQGLLEGALGLEPLAHRHQLSIRPCLPANWPSVTLRKLVIGTHTLSLQVGHDSLTVTHADGDEPMLIRFLLTTAGDLAAEAPFDAALEQDTAGVWLHLRLPPGHSAAITADAGTVTVASAASV